MKRFESKQERVSKHGSHPSTAPLVTSESHLQSITHNHNHALDHCIRDSPRENAAWLSALSLSSTLSTAKCSSHLNNASGCAMQNFSMPRRECCFEKYPHNIAGMTYAVRRFPCSGRNLGYGPGGQSPKPQLISVSINRPSASIRGPSASILIVF